MLAFKDFNLTYEGPSGGKRSILKDVNLCLPKGSITVITGASGCGKTSLIQVINGVIPEIRPAKLSGELIFKGENLLQNSITDRSRTIATVFQNPKNQFYSVNSLDEMAFGLENRNVPREKILQTIDTYTKLLKTEHLLNRDLLKLSGGEKQLVAITSVAAMDNAIYIFDEPSASLDQEAIRHLRETLKTLKEMGKIIIVAEHRLYYLKDILDQLIVIEGQKAISYEKDAITEQFTARHHLRTLEEVTESDWQASKLVDKCLNNPKGDDQGQLQCLRFCCHYKGKQEPVYSCNFSFDPGIYFIVGPNGVGKTSFARQLCGLNKEAKGEVYYKNKLVKDRSQLISLVMQDVNYQLFTESVESELSLVTEDGDKKERLLKELELWDKREAHPQSLSGGEKQRLALALTLASPKEVVVLDEPTSGLCLKNMEKLVGWLHELEGQGKTVIVVTHDDELIQLTQANIIRFKK